MRVLSIKQPWAWLILNGGKNIENRTWETKFRGRFLIHASKLVDQYAYRRLKEQGVPLPEIKDFQVGGIVGSVELVDIKVSKHPDVIDNKWNMGPRCWILKDPKELPFFEMKGQLQLFNTDLTEEKLIYFDKIKNYKLGELQL